MNIQVQKKARPILFSAPMVRAILEGRKTQTRRTRGLEFINQRPSCYEFQEMIIVKGELYAVFAREGSHARLHIKSPYGKSGDGLWVKENYRTSKSLDLVSPSNIAIGAGIDYEADGASNLPSGNMLCGSGKLRPSIFMCRWMSRITTEITNISAERLNDISEDDAIAEGVTQYVVDTPTGKLANKVIDDYIEIWKSINGKGSWGVNPWVFVVEFRRI